MRILLMLILAGPLGYMALDTLVRGESAPDYTLPVIAIFSIASWLFYKAPKQANDNSAKTRD